MHISLASFAISLTDLLYGLCSSLLLGAATYIGAKDYRSPAHRWFAATAFALLAWTATLFFFNRLQDPAALLWVGRANFAVVAFAVYGGYRFVRAVAQLPAPTNTPYLLLETLALTAITALTPFVDQAELVGIGSDGRHVTVYGWLFPLYLLHVMLYLAATLRITFGERRQGEDPVDDQLLLLGSGILLTGGISLVTNVVLPYSFGNFRWIDAGPLSTLLFLLAVAYAVAKHRLFDVRLFIRKTVVLGLLMTLALSAYSAVVVLVTEWFAAESAGTLTRFSVLVIAFSFDPVRRALEDRIDRLLFSRRRQAGGN